MQLQEDKITTLQTAIQTAYLDHTINSSLAYRPEFISNNYKLGKKVLVSIEEELQRCEEFCISVAFITESGITPLLQTLKDLEQRNIPGKILTTNYLMFSEPEALEKLAGLKNIELRMYVTNAETGGFHTKGYIFRKEEIYRIIIGSSNMTLSVITKNKEWNTKIVSTEQGELAQAVVDVEKHPFPRKLTKPVKEMLDILGRHSGFAYKILFANLWCLEPLFDKVCRASGGELNAMMRTTCAGLSVPASTWSLCPSCATPKTRSTYA